MIKERILQEIHRTAQQNGGKPLGFRTFEREMGIRVADWFGKIWKTWGDAVREAGFVANPLQDRIGDEELLSLYVALARELGRVPVKGDLRLKKRADPSFPSDRVFDRFGSKRKLNALARQYCTARPDFQATAALFPDAALPNEISALSKEPAIPPSGFVYLLRSGRYYKVGRTNAAGRREYELAIQLPEPAKLVHRIATDDPEGIEGYWHQRFAAKRMRGEWFKFDASDIAAFKRRRFQ
ncbi:MAG TPA: GIY-YIG nuclease family protein [Methylomirabilota bacterium]|nr:GIY-YIG nuclease family protein [Methylomirabilota bacterium]